MEQVKIRNLTFSYGEPSGFCLKNLSFGVQKGEILLLIGQSGCGKTTLLKHLKPEYTPQGFRSGNAEIFWENTCLEDMPPREQAAKIGYVRQNPESAAATDKVWHELAFGLESLGYKQKLMQQKVAEITEYFGLSGIYREPVAKLSGGQKQLVNLASVMVMNPELLILDEPTSQLDPIAANTFFQMVQKINQELGTTVLLTEHRLEEVFSFCDRVMVMDGGELVFIGTPRDTVMYLYENGHPMYQALPAPAKLFCELSGTGRVPLNVKEGRQWMTKLSKKLEQKDEKKDIRESAGTDMGRKNGEQAKKMVLTGSGLCFRYERESRDILKECDIALEQGKITALLGGNGAGKSTLLKVLAGVLKPYRGKIKNVNQTVGWMPQNPQAMFAGKTVKEELEKAAREADFCVSTGGRENAGWEDTDWRMKLEAVVKACRLECVLMQHPFDLSGGELQRLALAKLWLLDVDILLLDEPGKGLDYAAKEELGEILLSFARQKKTICFVSHDVEFAARFADVCGMFFDGYVAALQEAHTFFTQNMFYTTSIHRMCRQNIPDAVVMEDVLGNESHGEARDELNETGEEGKPHGEARDELNETGEEGEPDGEARDELSNVEKEGEPHGEGRDELSDVEKEGEPDGESRDGLSDVEKTAEHAGRKQDGTGRKQTAASRKRKKTIPLLFIFLILMPVTIYIGEAFLQQRKYYFIAMLLLLEAIISFFLGFEKRNPKIREIVVVAMFSAITVAARGAFYMLPNVKPMAALVILSGISFGGEAGFLVGAMSMLVSNIFFGQGPWTPWQMFAMGMPGLVAGVLCKQEPPLTWRRRIGLCVFGFIAVVILYGGIMNPASVIMYQDHVTFKMLAAAYAAGLPFDIVHGISTALFLLVGADLILEKLSRLKKKYGFYI